MKELVNKVTICGDNQVLLHFINEREYIVEFCEEYGVDFEYARDCNIDSYVVGTTGQVSKT